MLLELQNVGKTYETPSQKVTALDDVSMTLDLGEFKAVCGPSGCGKSTLLLLAGGLLAPTTGQVRIAGEDPYALPADLRAEFRARQIGFVFQQFHLVPYLTVLENVLAASIGTQLTDADSRARELLTQFGLESRLSHLPTELSTGERQRVAMARALLNRPKLLLADEPTGNLDRENAEIVMRYLVEFVNEGAVLLVTHDSRILEHVHHVEWIRDGRLVPPEE
ncbi:MAG: ABC transporter ATP-binding protein [Planctomycetaceae bacterium]